MLTDLCQELKNWFDRDKPKFYGKFTIHDNDIFFVNGTSGEEKSMGTLGLAENQYFRIVDSVFNDGVHKYASADLQTLTDEVYYGAVWLMAVPPAVVTLSASIDEWKSKYAEASFSPFTSESFGGYSYSKSASSGNGGGNPNGWRAMFKDELNKWRKL